MLLGCSWLFGSPNRLVRSQIKPRLKVMSLSLNQGGSVEKNCNFRMLAVNQAKMMISGVRQNFDQLILCLKQNWGQICLGHVLKHFSPPEASSVLLTSFSHTKCSQCPLLMMNKT